MTNKKWVLGDWLIEILHIYMKNMRFLPNVQSFFSNRFGFSAWKFNSQQPKVQRLRHESSIVGRRLLNTLHLTIEYWENGKMTIIRKVFIINLLAIRWKNAIFPTTEKYFSKNAKKRQDDDNIDQSWSWLFASKRRCRHKKILQLVSCRILFVGAEGVEPPTLCL